MGGVSYRNRSCLCLSTFIDKQAGINRFTLVPFTFHFQEPSCILLQSLLFLFGVCFIFILTTLSLGLFISTISRTQQQAMMTAIFFMMPAMLLSGIFSPIENMPKIIQYITILNPLKYFARAVRGILLKGNDFLILWPQVLALAIFGISAIILSSLRFKKHLE